MCLNDHQVGVSSSLNHLSSGSDKNMAITSGDHRVLMGSPAKFTTPVEPWMLSFHSGSSAILIPGKSLAVDTRAKLTNKSKVK